jgi:uncharacterized Tic20 family protein
MANWYYYDQTGKKCGPVDSKTLKTLAQQGLITADTIIENEQGKSAKAGIIKGLEFPSRAIPVPPVYSGSSATSPLQNSSAEGTLLGMEPNTYFMLMHIVGLLFIPAVIVMWAIAKDKDTRADIHGKVIFNWLISLFIYTFIGSIACLIIIGIFVIIAVGICALIFPILAAVKASKGEIWKYPCSITFFRTGLPQQRVAYTIGKFINTSITFFLIHFPYRKFIFVVLLIFAIIAIGFFSGKKREKEIDSITRRQQEVFVGEKGQETEGKKQKVSEKKQEDFYSAEIIEKQIDAKIAEINEEIAERNAEITEWNKRYVNPILQREKREKFDLSQNEKKAIIDYLLLLQETTREKHSEAGLGSGLKDIRYYKEYKKNENKKEYEKKPEYEKLLRYEELDIYVVNLIHLNIIQPGNLTTALSIDMSIGDHQIDRIKRGEQKKIYLLSHYAEDVRARTEVIRGMLPESNRRSGNAHGTEEKERLDEIKREKEEREREEKRKKEKEALFK